MAADDHFFCNTAEDVRLNYAILPSCLSCVMLSCFVLQIEADHSSFINCALVSCRPYSTTHHCFSSLLCMSSPQHIRPVCRVFACPPALFCVTRQVSAHCHSSTTVQGVLQDVELNQRMTEVCRLAVRAFVEDRTDKDGRVSIKALNKFAQMTGLGAQEPWVNVIKVCLPSCRKATLATYVSQNQFLLGW